MGDGGGEGKPPGVEGGRVRVIVRYVMDDEPNGRERSDSSLAPPG
jgi:hypothetical protein